MAVDVEPRYPLGDCGDLLRYRLRDGQLTPIEPRRPYGPLGHYWLPITVDIRGLRITEEMLTDRPNVVEQTKRLIEAQREAALRDIERELGIPWTDPSTYEGGGRTSAQTRYLQTVAVVLGIYVLVVIIIVLATN